MKSLQCLIDLFIDLLDLRSIISDVLDIFSIWGVKPLGKHQKSRTPNYLGPIYDAIKS